MKQLTGKAITDGALAQRRARLPAAAFEQMMDAALQPKADPHQHPDAFYQGLRLCTVDGSRFSITNTPQVKKHMRKARRRRGRAAFPKVGAVVMVELVRRALRQIADMAIPKRRARACSRALRQPVTSWPRLRKNTCRKGPVEYSVGHIYARIPIRL